MGSKASKVRKKIRASKKKVLKDRASESVKLRARKLATMYDINYDAALAYAKSEARRRKLKEGSARAFKQAKQGSIVVGKVAGKGLKLFGKYMVEVKKYEEEQKKQRQRK